ncbi:MAG: PEP-CTERM sorting domain-containing protein [Planctomycetales bacterium]|nr:PEP-CTERM sorting domain-containing protein [Planctomycetales bacterium]
MIRKCAVLVSLAIMLGQASTTATAQTAVVAASTGVSTIAPCPSFCGGSGGVFDSDIDGGVGFIVSQSSLDNAQGIGNAYADLSGPIDLPLLRAESYSNPNSRVSSQAFGMQGFYVTGSEYSLDVALAGIAFDAPSVPGVSNEDGSAVAHVMIFRDNDPSTPVAPFSDYGTMRFEVIPGTGDLELLADAVEPSGLATLSITPDNQVHIVGTTLTATGLLPNDLIYVWANLSTSGTRGGFGDAFDTLTMQFQNPQGLSHTPHPSVPEPASYVLLGLGALALGTRPSKALRG